MTSGVVYTVQDNLLVIYFKDYKDLILEEVRDTHHHTHHTPTPEVEDKIRGSLYTSDLPV